MGPPVLRSHIKCDTHKKLNKESKDIDTDALGTFCDEKANQATKSSAGQKQFSEKRLQVISKMHLKMLLNRGFCGA